MTASTPRPLWLRPASIVLVIGAHAAVFVTVPPPPIVPASGPIEIAVVVEQETEDRAIPDQMPSPDARAEPPPPEPIPEPEPVAEPVAVEPDPPPPEPPTPEIVEAPPPPALPPEAVRVERPPEPPVKRVEPRPKRETPREPRRPPATVDSTAARAAQAEAAAERRATAASYAAQVSAELARHRHYPAAAREAGISGTVVVAFVLGPGGRVATHSIVRSSGHAVLDQAVHAMMAAVHLPPPPGGVFRSTVPVRFDLVR